MDADFDVCLPDEISLIDSIGLLDAAAAAAVWRVVAIERLWRLSFDDGKL